MNNLTETDGDSAPPLRAIRGLHNSTLLYGLRERRSRLVQSFASTAVGDGELPPTSLLQGLATVQLAIGACETEMVD